MSDIAAEVGVSRSAVSLVLNNRPDSRIPEVTRQRILSTALELGYRTNQLARAVASGKTQMIGYLVSEPNYEPSWRVITGALAEAEVLGFTLKVLSVTPETFAERVRQCVELRLSGIVAGLMSGHQLVLEEANRARIPVAVVDPGVAQSSGTNVLADDAVGLNAAIDHLQSLHHRRIGFISSGFPQLYGGADDIGITREKLFERIMGEHGLAVPEGAIVRETMTVFGSHAEEETNLDSVRLALYDLMEHSDGPRTAICCWRDETAMAVIQACAQAGLKVPEDVSVVGFSDLSVARFFAPPLSTIQSPWDALGRLAVRQLSERLGENFSSSPTVHRVPSRFIARQSTARATR